MRRRTILTGTAAAAAGAAIASGAAAQGKRAYRRIATEEGFITPGVLAQNARTQTPPGVPLMKADGPGAASARNLLDIDAGRIAAMDADGIDMP